MRRLIGGKQRGNTGGDGASLKAHLDTSDTQCPEDTPRCHMGRRNNVKKGTVNTLGLELYL